MPSDADAREPRPARAPFEPANRACLIAAFAVPIAWFFITARFRPDYLVDESGHLGAIYHYLEHKPGWPEHVTMLPGYHFIVVALWQLHPPFSLLTLARLVSTLAALGGLAAFTVAWQRFHRLPAGPAVLLLALLPILQPFTGLAYSDMPALACVLAAFAAHLAGRFALAALAFTFAACIRQTDLVWAAALVAREGFGVLLPSAPADASAQAAGRLSWREFFNRTRWLLLLLVIAAAIVLAAGRFTLGTQTGNDLHPNIATLHLAGLLALLLGLPVWLAHAPGVLRRWFASARVRPIRFLAGATLALAAAAALAFTFANPHAWNREFFWDDGKFTLLRNWPLILIDTHPWLRAASGLNLVLMTVALVAAFRAQAHRRDLWLMLAFGALLPASSNLVEPRYFIAPIVLILIFLDLARAETRRLIVWWALLCAGHAPFVARGVSLW